MTIGINGWFMQFPYTGIGQYTAGLLREFGADTAVDFLVAVPNDELIARVQAIAPHVTCVCVRAVRWLPAGLRKHWWEQVQVPLFFARRAVDVAFFPYPAMPMLLAWRALRFLLGAMFGAANGAESGAAGAVRIRTVVTIHDTIPWTDARYRRGVLSALAHMVQRHLAAHADHIITVSRASATAIMKVCGVAADRITVISNGVSAAFCEKPSDDIIARACTQFGVARDNYFLYVGGYDIRKRVDMLVPSFLRYAKPEQKLVLVGGAVGDATSANGGAAYETARIIKTGFIDDQTLAALYAGGRAFVHFSQHEGFNIPLAQALSLGTPALVSDIDAHREVAREHVWYCEPTDTASLMRGWQMITDGAPSSRDAMRSPCNCTGAHRTFPWHEAAQHHLLTLRLIKA